jgi:Ca2+-binding EF-hand superfamily protein
LDTFLEEHPDGRLGKREFRQMVSQALPGRDVGKMEKHVFRCYDQDDNGHIDGVEFMVGQQRKPCIIVAQLVYHIMAEGSPEEVLVRIFRVFDISQDGSISEKELKRIVKDMFALIKNQAPEEVGELIIVGPRAATLSK